MKRVAMDNLRAQELGSRTWASPSSAGLVTSSDESSFVDAIHRAFPYADATTATQLAQQSLRISANSAFMVLHEVVFPAEAGVEASAGQKAALQVLESALRHPLKSVLLPLAQPLIAGQRLNQDDTLALLRRVEPFQGQYNALAIGYRAYGGMRPEVGREYTAILGRWQRQRWLD